MILRMHGIGKQEQARKQDQQRHADLQRKTWCFVSLGQEIRAKKTFQ